MSDTEKLSTKQPLTKKDVDKAAARSRGLTQAKVKELIQAAILEHHKDDPQAITEAQVQDLIVKSIEEAEETIKGIMEKVVKNLIEKLGSKSPRVFLINVRWEHPHFGGFPMPVGTCWYGFKTFRMTEPEFGVGIPEEEILERALEEGAQEKGLTIEGVSVFPILRMLDINQSLDPDVIAPAPELS